jgi:hypothetical protein
MRRDALLLCAAILPFCACGRKADQAKPIAEANESRQESPARVQPTENRTSPQEPDETVDPKSAEAASQVVQSYGALVGQGRWDEANALWGDRAAAAKFQSELAQFPDVHLETGNPGDLGGAAGSIYVTVPVILYGDSKDGQPFRRSADAVLRRVNDVPGSTEAQRRWHIERVDLAG